MISGVGGIRSNVADLDIHKKISANTNTNTNTNTNRIQIQIQIQMGGVVKER